MTTESILSEEIRYSGDGIEMNGYVAWDDNIDGERPGIVVVHEWWGQTDYPRERANMLASLGYTAFALDLYGAGKTAKNPDEAGAMMTALTADLPALRARFEAALETLKAHRKVDAGRTGAIGYCFGGAVVLHMARMGADLDSVVSFHGDLSLAVADGVEKMSTRVLACNGQADVFVPAEAIAAFKAEMKKAGADYQFIQLPGTLHGFSNPAATGNGEKYGLPLKYSKAADEASWAQMRLLFADTFFSGN
jgi:dienelactone hydrolase